VNYSGGQYDDPAENTTEDFYRRLDGFLHSHEDPHYYDQYPQAHIDELDNDDYPPPDTDVIKDHDNEEDYYPAPNNDYDYSDDESHKYHKLSDIDKLNEEFPSIDSERYYTPDESPNSSYHTADDGPYEDLEDFCCAYCAEQHPDNWCPTPHYSCLDTCLVPEDHPYYIDNIPVDVTCPAEGQHCPYSYWA
jgi:hypothetical protein